MLGGNQVFSNRLNEAFYRIDTLGYTVIEMLVTIILFFPHRAKIIVSACRRGLRLRKRYCRDYAAYVEHYGSAVRQLLSDMNYGSSLADATLRYAATLAVMVIGLVSARPTPGRTVSKAWGAWAGPAHAPPGESVGSVLRVTSVLA